MLKKSFPFYKQADSKDCGATCVKIIAKHYGKVLNIQTLRVLSETTREGANLLNLSDAIEQIGIRTIGIKSSLNKFTDAPLPCILHWNNNHYVVLYKIKNDAFYISDPAIGLIKYSKSDFIKFWIGNNADENTEEGIALLVEPTPAFYNSEFDKEEEKSFPNKGYCASQKMHYYGYKLHAVCSVSGVFTNVNFTQAFVHDIHFL